MHIRILGSAAGGGFPQWNCACRNCTELRAGTLKATTRTQTQLAFSPDGLVWFLLGASPDLRTQIVATPQLARPPTETTGISILFRICYSSRAENPQIRKPYLRRSASRRSAGTMAKPHSQRTPGLPLR